MSVSKVFVSNVTLDNAGSLIVIANLQNYVYHSIWANFHLLYKNPQKATVLKHSY